MEYAQTALEARKTVLELIYKAQTSHIGSNFSCIDLMTVVFDIINLDRDKFILSKGWAAASLYYFLYKKGKITREELYSYCQPGSKWIGLTEPIHPDIPFAGGSMGMGLPAGVGFALAKKMKQENGKVYVLMSDGEMQCGTTWESALIAAHHNLDNLCVLVDKNNLQAMGKTRNILDIDSVTIKFRSFGWSVDIIDGHNFHSIRKALSVKSSFPRMISAYTIKGRGVYFMENNNLYHYKHLSDEEYKLALKALEEGIYD